MNGASSMQRIVIIGAGGHGREQLDLISAINTVSSRYRVEGFVVDPEYAAPGKKIAGLPVLGGVDWLATHARDVVAVCAIGGSAARMRTVERLRDTSVGFETLVHPAATVSDTATLEEGAIVCAGSVLTSGVRVGAHAHVGVGSVVSHDCVLEAFASLAPGCRLAGAVRVAVGAQLGVGTVVRDRITIGTWSITGAGAVAVDDVPADSTVMGVPARPVETRSSGWQNETPSTEGKPAARHLGAERVGGGS